MSTKIGYLGGKKNTYRKITGTTGTFGLFKLKLTVKVSKNFLYNFSTDYL